MPRRGYALTFLLVLLVTCAGAFVAGRWLWLNLRGSMAAGQAWTPPVASVTPGGVAQAGHSPIAPTATPRPSATRVAIPTLIIATLPPPTTAAPVQPETPTPGTPRPTVTSTPAVTATRPDTFSFGLASPVRNSTGDCPGNYVLGSVLDRAGNPMPDVQLWLQDEFGNQDRKVSKSGADAGKYDFPLSGPPRRFYLAIVDATGKELSARVEIGHGVGTDAGASCHWVTWRQR
jgi:hypothetical protein